MYYTYMLRCADNSIYTGITTDVARRFAEHSAKMWSSVKISDSDFEKILPLSYAAMLLSVACCM